MASVFDELGLPDPNKPKDVFDELGLPRPKAPEAPPRQTVSDYAKQFAAGAAGAFVTAPGAIMESFGASDRTRLEGQRIEQAILDSRTEQSKALDSQPLFDEEWNVSPQWGQKLLSGAAQSAPTLVQAFIMGRPVQQWMAGADTAGKVAGAAARLGVPAKAGKVIGNAVEALPFSAVEGLSAGGQAAAGQMQEIEQAPIEQLRTVDRFNAILAETDPTLPADQREALARDQMKGEAARSTGAKTAAWTSGAGFLTGGGVLGPIARQMTGKGGAKNLGTAIAKGFGEEAAQEAPQSAGEHYLANVGRRDYVDPTQDPWSGVFQAGAEGGLTGGLLGGFASGAVHRRPPAQPVPEAQPNAGATPSGATPPNAPMAPPPDPAGPIGAAVVAGQGSGAIPTNPAGGPVDAPGNEEVNQSPGSMNKPSLAEKPVRNEKTAALTEVARVAATVPPGTDIPPQSTLGQAIVGATRKAIDAGATDAELAAARAGQIEAGPEKDPKEVDKQISTVIDSIAKLTTQIGRANAAAEKAREKGDTETVANATQLADTMRDRLEQSRRQLSALQGAAGGQDLGADDQANLTGADGRGSELGSALAAGRGDDLVPRSDASGGAVGGAAAVPVPAGNAGGAGAVSQSLTPEIIEPEAFSDGPNAAPGPRWTADRGAMPGEPFAFLGPDPDTAIAAIREVAVPGQGVYYEVTAPGGKLLASGSTAQEAARLAEQRLAPPAGSLPANPQETRSVPAGKPARQTREQAAKARKQAYREANPFKSFLAEYGINTADRADAGGDPRRPVLVPYHGALFRGTGMRLDELARRAVEHGFLTQADIDSPMDNGGVNKLSDMIRRVLAGERIRPVAAAASAEEQEWEAQAQARYDAMAEAEDAVAALTDDEINGLLQLARDEDAELRNEEIDLALEPGEAQESSGGAEEGAAGTEAGGDSASSAAARDQDPGEVDTFLSSPTAEGLRAQAQQRDNEQQAQARRDAAPPAEDFTLAGSGRPADQAAARGQMDFGGDAPATLFGMSGAQLEAMQGGRLSGADQFPGHAPTENERERAAKRREDRERAESEALNAAAASDPRLAALRDAGVEPTAVVNAAKELREGDDSLLRDLARIHDVNLPAPVDAAAAQAATSPKNDTPEPSDAQKDAGNYKKGHTRISGLDIAIENEAGTHRRPTWPALSAHYGYVKRTEGADGDQVDVFIKTGTPEDFAGDVFVIDQHVDGKFDEHKVMLGFGSQPEAAKAYRESYTKDWKGLGAIRRMTMGEFKAWLKDGDTTAQPEGESPAEQHAEGLNGDALDRDIKLEVRIEDSGETATITVRAGDAMADVDKRIETARALAECLK